MGVRVHGIDLLGYISNLKIETLIEDPVSPEYPRIWYNTTEDALKFTIQVGSSNNVEVKSIGSGGGTVLYGTSATPPDAGSYPNGTLYCQI